ESGDEVPEVLEWAWDRHDAYGRFVQGAVDATVVVSYEYAVSYLSGPVGITSAGGLSPGQQALEDEESGDFGEYAAADGSVVRLGRDYTRITRQEVVALGGWDVTRE